MIFIRRVAALFLGVLLWTPLTRAEEWRLQPFATVAGGVKYEDFHPEQYTREGVPSSSDFEKDRIFTTAVSQFGLRGVLSGGFFLLSEFEANAGLNGHGTSVWEGQAALQARRQIVRFEDFGLRVDVGHVQDDSSLDFVSLHVMDMLLTDRYTRDPFIASGANHGNGLYATYQLFSGLGVGFAVNAGNAVGTTASAMVKGKFGHSDLFGWVLKAAGSDPGRLPPDTYQFLVFTPSLVFQTDLIEAHAAAQIFTLDLQTGHTADDPVEGYNLRAGVKLKLLDNLLVPFANFSFESNDGTDSGEPPRKMEGVTYRGMTAGGGLDCNISGKSGIGAQYMLVRDQSTGFPTGDYDNLSHYINLGGTYWLNQRTSVGARVGFYRFVSQEKSYGDMSFFLTARVIL